MAKTFLFFKSPTTEDQVTPPTTDPLPSDLSNVVLVDNNLKEIFTTPNPELFDSNNYTPIGVVVIPAEHNVYGDGSSGILALTFIDSDNPLGSSIINNVKHYEALPNTILDLNADITFTQYIPTTGHNSPYFDNEMYDITKNSGYAPSLPQQNSSNGHNYPYDDCGWFDYGDEAGFSYGHSPYYDGEKNPSYYSPLIENLHNGLSDFNGKENTKKILNDSEIANLCNNFYTIGTNAGDWYLPTIGEIGYLPSRAYDILNRMPYDWYTFITSGIGIATSSVAKKQENIKLCSLGFSYDTRIVCDRDSLYVIPFTHMVLPIKEKP